MWQAEETGARVREAASLSDLLAAAFDAFEVIRRFARASEDLVPGLFAAFMATADAAVGGREAVTIAPSLPPGRSGADAVTAATAGTGAEEIAAALATLGSLLSERLTLAATNAPTPGDHDACEEAAEAAQRIHHLMAGDGDGRLW